MAHNRAAAIKYVLDNLEALVPGNSDTERYKAYLEGLSDKELTQYFQDLRDRTKWLTITVPNFGKSRIDIERNYKLADKLGLRFHKKVWYPNGEDGSSYQSEIDRLVIMQPVRIASQRLDKKKSIPKNQRSVNMLTGQPTGASKGASFSFPEIRLARAMGLEGSVVELIKYRGGDLRGNAALTASLIRTGRASIDVLKHYASGVESTARVQTYFNCMHLRMEV